MKTISRKLFLGAAFLMVFLFIPHSTGLFSQSAGCKQQAAKAMVIVAKALQSKGFSLNGTTPKYGFLNEGQKASFSSMLMKGNVYAFVVAGGCVAKITLFVYDENKNLIAKYGGGKPFAAVMVVPKWTGKFYGIVQLQGTTQNPAVVVQLLGWKTNI